MKLLPLAFLPPLVLPSSPSDNADNGGWQAIADFIEVDDADLERYVERLTTPAPRHAR